MTFTMIEQYLGGVQMAKFEFLNISRLYSVLISNREYLNAYFYALFQIPRINKDLRTVPGSIVFVVMLRISWG